MQSILNIHLPKAPSEFETRAIIHVKYISVDKAGKTTILPAKENKVQLRTDAGGRVEINLTHLTRQWMKYPMENLGVVIKVQIENNNVKEMDIGQVGTSQVCISVFLSKSSHECVVSSRGPIFKSTSRMELGGPESRGRPAGSALRSMTPK